MFGEADERTMCAAHTETLRESDEPPYRKRRRVHPSLLRQPTLEALAGAIAEMEDPGSLGGTIVAAHAGMQAQAIVRAAQKLWLGLKQVSGLLVYDADQVDPLVALVRQDPVSAPWFIEVLMLSTGILSALACAICIFLVAFFWQVSAERSDRHLRLWLMAHAGQQAVQVPVRLRFWVEVGAARIHASKLGEAKRSLERLDKLVVTTTENWAWKLVRVVSLITHAWLAFALVRVLMSSTWGAGASGLSFSCAVMVALMGLKAVFVSQLFNKFFGG